LQETPVAEDTPKPEPQPSWWDSIPLPAPVKKYALVLILWLLSVGAGYIAGKTGSTPPALEEAAK
jgi:hypothetical protein